MDDAATSTVSDALADALRKVMAMNGRPFRSDYHPKQMDLYEQHEREWQQAMRALDAYERERS